MNIAKMILVVGLLVSGCTESETTAPITIPPFVQSPFTEIDPPALVYTFWAEEGAEITYPSGSKLIIPKNALLDVQGKPVTGAVDISYKEFSNPLDFFTSGIPMEYDSANTDYVFESAGMCEIYATQKGEPVFVNPEHQPTLKLATFNEDPRQNLYYLDTNERRWLPQGKSTVEPNEDFTMKPSEPAPLELENGKLLYPPLEPQRPTGELPIFSVVIAENEREPELRIFKNAQFELHADEAPDYNPNEAHIIWFEADLEPTDERGVYWLTFSNYSQKVKHRVRPVYAGKNYKQALQQFELETKQFKAEQERLEKKRAEELAEKKRQWKRDSIAWVQAETKRLAEEEAKWKADSTQWEKERLAEEQRRFQERINEGGRQMETEIQRTFQINRFGIWNCDRPMLRSGIDILASFQDEQGKPIQLEQTNLVYRELNAIFPQSGQNMRILPNNAAMIWGVVGKRIAYLTYDDFKQYPIDRYSTKSVDFTLRVSDEITSKKQLESLLQL